MPVYPYLADEPDNCPEDYGRVDQPSDAAPRLAY